MARWAEPQPWIHKALGALWFITGSVLLFVYSDSAHFRNIPTERKEQTVFLLTKLHATDILHALKDFLILSPNKELLEPSCHCVLGGESHPAMVGPGSLQLLEHMAAESGGFKPHGFMSCGSGTWKSDKGLTGLPAGGLCSSWGRQGKIYFLISSTF